MSAAKHAPSREPTIAEEYVHHMRESRARGASRRSKNTGVRTLDEVRATFRDAATQIRALARKQGRADFAALASVMERTLKYLLSVEPHTPVEIETKLSKIGAQAFERCAEAETDAVFGAVRAGGRHVGPTLFLPATHEGLAMMQRAVAERVSAGLLPAEPRDDPNSPRAIQERQERREELRKLGFDLDAIERELDP